MSEAEKVLVFSGSERKGSFNRRLSELAAEALSARGFGITRVDLRALDLPIYDGDLEAESGAPEGAVTLQRHLKAHRGVVIACPEYNGGMAPLLKNALDWASRPSDFAKGITLFKGKIGLLLSASPSPFGGLRSISQARLVLAHMGMILVGDQLCVPNASSAFDEDGGLAVEAARKQLETCVERFSREIRAQSDAEAQPSAQA